MGFLPLMGFLTAMGFLPIVGFLPLKEIPAGGVSTIGGISQGWRAPL